MPVSKRPQAIAVLLRLADEVGHLLLERVEALVEGEHRGLGRRGIVGETGGVGGPALGEHLPLHLLNLLLEPVEALLGSRRRLALRKRGGRHESRRRRTPQER